MSAGQQRAEASFQGWQTPPHVVAALHHLWLAGFVDPCTSADNPTSAREWYTEARPLIDGVGSWQGIRVMAPVYMNPPWAEMAAWIERLACWAPPAWVLCGPATPDRLWFRTVARLAKVVVFGTGRPAFVDPRTGKLRRGAPTGAFFAYRGPDVLRFVEWFGHLGTVWYPGHEPGEAGGDAEATPEDHVESSDRGVPRDVGTSLGAGGAEGARR